MLANSPLSFKYKEKVYQLANLRLKEWGQFCDWVAFYKYHRAKAQSVDSATLKELLSEALDTRLAIDSPEVFAKIFSADGSLKLVELSLRRGNPKITETEIEELLEEQPFTDEDQIPAFGDRFLDLIGIKVPKNETTPNQTEAVEPL